MRLIACHLLVALALVGCSSADDGAELPARRRTDLEERLRYHGFKEPTDVERLVLELRDAAKRGDKATLVNAIHYPFRTYEKGSPVREYASPADILGDYDAIFSARVLTALSNARYDRLFVRDQGAMIGDGEVWLFQFDEGVRIKAINSAWPEPPIR